MSSRRLPDLRLMLVTDPVLMAQRGLLQATMAAVAGGATIVQLRDKTADDNTLTAIAAGLVVLLTPLRVPLIVNDRPQVAKAAGAAGVHIGQGDVSAAAARDLLGPDALIGLSVTNDREVVTVDAAIVDYVGLGPVFASATKADAAPALGLAAIRAIGATLPVPFLAIGGIDVGNAAAVMRTGAAGVAVVSAIAGADDPSAAAASIRRAIDEGASG